MNKFCRFLLLSLLGLLMVQPGAARRASAQSQPDTHRETHEKSKSKYKKPKVRHTKTILKGRHGKHAHRPA